MTTPTSTVVICPIRYDGGPRPDDRQLWMEIRRLFRDSTTRPLAFVSVSSASYWIDEFNPLPHGSRLSA